jgi:hypothetical protein
MLACEQAGIGWPSSATRDSAQPLAATIFRTVDPVAHRLAPLARHAYVANSGRLRSHVSSGHCDHENGAGENKNAIARPMRAGRGRLAERPARCAARSMTASGAERSRRIVDAPGPVTPKLATEVRLPLRCAMGSARAFAKGVTHALAASDVSDSVERLGALHAVLPQPYSGVKGPGRRRGEGTRPVAAAAGTPHHPLRDRTRPTRGPPKLRTPDWQ